MRSAMVDQFSSAIIFHDIAVIPEQDDRAALLRLYRSVSSHV
jgi:hypothetical protein